MSWLPDPRWIPVFFLMYMGIKVRRAVFSPGEFTSSNPFNKENIEKSAIYLPLFATKIYLYIFVITSLFPPTYPNLITHSAWLARSNSLIDAWTIAWLLGAWCIVEAALRIAHDLRRPYVTAGVLLFRQLQRSLTYLVGSALMLNILFVYAANLHSGFALKPSWWPAWLLWLMGGFFVLVLPSTAINIFVASRYAAIAGLKWLRGIGNFAVVAKPYFFRDRSGFADHYDLSLDASVALRTVGSHDERTVRLLVFSDLHIAPVGSNVMSSDVDSTITLDRLRDITQCIRPDTILLLGDLTDTGDEDAWRRLSHETTLLRTPVLAVPGNHDVHFAQYNSFDTAEPFYSADEICSRLCVITDRPSIAFPIVERVKGSRLILVLLDSNCHQSAGPISNAIGLVGDTQLGTAGVELQRIRRPEDVVIVALHHHILLPDGGPMKWYLRCLDADAVLEFAKGCQAAAVVTGHLHMPYVAAYDSTLMVVSCGSLHHDPEGPLGDKAAVPSAHLFELSGNRLTVSFVPAR